MTSTVAGAGKEFKMENEMNQAEIAREETEQKMVYKFLMMISESKDNKETIEQLEQKVKALVKS
jgi:hypothetical protein